MEGIVYEIVDRVSEKDEFCKIKLLEDPYAGVVYNYTTVSFDEQLMKLKFNYDLWRTPEDFELEELTEEEQNAFEILLGDILLNLMEEALDADRTDNLGDTDE